MNTVLKNYHAAAPFVALALFIATPQLAAGQDTLQARGSRIVLEVDADGRLVVNGRTVDDEAGGRYVLRLDTDEDDGTIVLHASPGRFGLGAVRAPRGARGFAFHTRDPFDGRHGFDVPDVHFFDRLDDDLAPLIAGPDAPHVLMLDRLRENAEVAEMEHEARRLARDARRAEGAERQRLESDLRAKLEAIFDEKLEVRRGHVERLERDLQEARRNLEAREGARADMIDRRLRELLGEDDALQW